MQRTHHSVTSALSLAVAGPSCEVLDIIATPASALVPTAKTVPFAPGPLPCRCGHYLSEDFDGRLFCRGCEGTEPADITSRLPLCRRSR
jgi:hypothetical protein